MGIRALIGVLCAALLAPAFAAAELRFSLTIEGSPEEIMAVLRQLRRSGIGGNAEEAGGDPLRLRVFSATGDAVETPAPAGSAAPEPPVDLRAALVSPPGGPPGAPVLITVRVRDEEHRVDTVAAWIPAVSLTADLHDNGQGGDVTAGDGIWSATLAVPDTLPDGAHEVTLTAYDANGDVIAFTGPEGVREPVTATTQLVVRREAP